MLNRCFDRMSAEIVAEGGLVDKFGATAFSPSSGRRSTRRPTMPRAPSAQRS
jgi:hypothetical protein